MDVRKLSDEQMAETKAKLVEFKDMLERLADGPIELVVVAHQHHSDDIPCEGCAIFTPLKDITDIAGVLTQAALISHDMLAKEKAKDVVDNFLNDLQTRH